MRTRSKFIHLLVCLWLVGTVFSMGAAPLEVKAQSSQEKSCDNELDCPTLYYCKGLPKDKDSEQRGTCVCGFGEFEAPLPGIDGSQNICDFVNGQNTPYVAIAQIVVNVLTGLIVSMALVMMLVAGYIYMTAGGDAARVGLAKKIIGGALLGLVLALTAFILLNTLSPQFASQVNEPPF